LIGDFAVDAEGVVPDDSLILVEDGFLKSLLNNRTPSHTITKSNGYNRFAVGAGSFSRGLAPGIVTITSPNTQPADSLKATLLSLAKEEGMKYAILAKPAKGIKATIKPVNFYKVDLASGEETLIRSVMNVEFPENPLRKMIGIGNEQVVQNMMDGGSYGQGNTGFPVSIIAPDAVLIEEFKMQGMPKTLTTGNLPVVSHPNKEE
jgi:hypothetical protein